MSLITLLGPVACLAGVQAQNCLNTVNATGYLNYTTVTDYFLQDNPTTNASTFDYVSTDERGPRNPS